jgi:hypothetical protein
MSRPLGPVRTGSTDVIARLFPTRQTIEVRFVVMSVAIHAVVVWLVVRAGEEPIEMPPRPPSRIVHVEPVAFVVEMIDVTGGGGGAGGGAKALAIARTKSAWDGLSVRQEGHASGSGNGNGNGNGDGGRNGNGIGFGNGGGVEVAHDVPAPPVPVESKARPAKLIWPTRDLDVEDESYLFVAKVTVDEEGSVVGARMITTRPGSRGDAASNAIWRFRYRPALDEHGVPVRSTFEQPFQVR